MQSGPDDVMGNLNELLLITIKPITTLIDDSITLVAAKSYTFVLTKLDTSPGKIDNKSPERFKFSGENTSRTKSRLSYNMRSCLLIFHGR